MSSQYAGKPAPEELLANIPNVISSYYLFTPDPGNPSQRVSFGTSGHRGSSLKSTFNEMHIQAIVQAICDCRRDFGAAGPLFLGMDTHALSLPAHITALSVLAANNVKTYFAPGTSFTPTPVISRSIIRYNRGRNTELADGIVITPSHNSPEDGGIKYNGTHGGPSDTEITKAIAALANKYLENGNKGVKTISCFNNARKTGILQEFDYRTAYVNDLDSIIDFDAIREANLRIGADALGGAGFTYWKAIAEKYSLNITVMHDSWQPDFRFMCVDHDGKIRMDCSSPYAMAGLVSMKDKFDLGVANDPDFDRHGIVCPVHGLMQPNHYLAVAIDYLFSTRKAWKADTGVGKTAVSSMMIDRVAANLGRKLTEVPVGFKWFVPGLTDGSLGFGGEESAGASFLQKDGSVWSTDKDGIIMALLACEITAVKGKNPAELYKEMEAEFGKSYYSRRDTPATAAQKKALAAIDPESLGMTDLAGDNITAILTNAPGNNAPIGGVKICGENCWAAVRPSGTEEICKVYGESLLSAEHLEKVLDQASRLLNI